VVYLTRTDDSFRPLLERTAFANERRADIFVSLHANASPDPRINGVESYYLDTSDGESARKLAERENASVRFEGPAADVAYMLSDLVQSAKTAESVGLARAVQHALVARLREGWPDVRDLGVKKALFYVLVGAHMPCVLVEIGFMNHPVEGPRIASERYRTAVARGIFDGLKAYLVAGEKR
jgi:N-acetylmuramoyl-L-alanine amidase